MSTVQKEHRLMVDSLKDKLHIAQSDLATMQQKQQQQQQQQQQQVSRSSLGSERRSLPLRNNMSLSDLSRVEVRAWELVFINPRVQRD